MLIVMGGRGPALARLVEAHLQEVSSENLEIAMKQKIMEALSNRFCWLNDNPVRKKRIEDDIQIEYYASDRLDFDNIRIDDARLPTTNHTPLIIAATTKAYIGRDVVAIARINITIDCC